MNYVEVLLELEILLFFNEGILNLVSIKQAKEMATTKFKWWPSKIEFHRFTTFLFLILLFVADFVDSRLSFLTNCCLKAVLTE